ncbi:MAG: branched-chain amino acid ABC transporter permease [Candidatus Rokubacteria bacterium]|nr:branched-chain amino acid ABC transporter permease [Candidatus Rokubacteria bacterium]MBI2155368.1 branched-chain amino acid ABC transporter permease [Candidatus Rokubacteria bacterium]
MRFFLQLLVTGVALGSIYALIALGFVLIYKSTRIINFAQGELVLIGAFTAFAFLSQAGLPPALALPLTIVVAVVLGFTVERLLLRPMLGEPVIAVIMVTLGLAGILKGSARAIWGSVNRPFPDIFPALSLTLFGVGIPGPFLWGCLIAGVCLVAFTLFFRFSGWGVMMRAAANHQAAALSVGIDVRRVFALSWAIAAAVAALGGVLLGAINVIDMNLGAIGLKVFPVVILGGLDSIPGAILGGLIIGVLENLSGGFIEPWVGGGVKAVAPFVALLLILLIRPYGLFGTREIERL